jgi:opacity protein-like surface antigen
MRLFASAVLVAVGTLSITGDARAQAYDGTHHIVRVGAFYMPHKVTSDLTVAAGAPQSISNVNHTGGLVAGIEWMRHGWRYGVEFDFAPLSGHAVTAAGEVAVNYAASLRGRLAVELHQDFRIYGTLGIEALGLETRNTLLGNAKQSDTKAGFIIGGGIERDWHHVTLFAEILHTFYGNHDIVVGGVAHQYRDLDDTSVRLGIKFKVGHEFWGYRDDVKERLGTLK